MTETQSVQESGYDFIGRESRMLQDLKNKPVGSQVDYSYDPRDKTDYLEYHIKRQAKDMGLKVNTQLDRRNSKIIVVLEAFEATENAEEASWVTAFRNRFASLFGGGRKQPEED